MTDRPLTAKQARFRDEYLVDLNSTQAAIRAGYSPKTAEIIGFENLRKPKIAAAIAAAMAERSQRTAITQDAVLHEIALLQHSDITHYTFDAQGQVHLTAGAPRDAMRAVASLRRKVIPTEAGPIYETEIKLWNKPASVRMGAQHLGLLTERVDVSGTVKVVRLPQKAPSAEVWNDAHRRTDLGTPAEAN